MLRAQGLAHRYGDTMALRGASLDVHPGEVVAILGPNGAGKSTLLQVLAGVLRADGGSAEVAGAKLPGDERALAAKVGFVPQGESVYPELTVEENLRFFGRLHGLGGRRLRERVKRALQEVALADRADARASDLSGGLRQRLALAASTLHDPPVLLLDEPGTGLDPIARDRLHEALRALRAQGRAVLLSTHSFEEAARVADRVVILARGRVAAVMPAASRADLERKFREAERA
ncbi:MAG TPA: ABC transporter ATP-binding protein [Candidatus Thermoplasmatota archaeon]|nr:ABC transporter ATP-binding protein [Candidatus Thermoplasmatota archaeon]